MRWSAYTPHRDCAIQSGSAYYTATCNGVVISPDSARGDTPRSGAAIVLTLMSIIAIIALQAIHSH